MCKRSSDQRDRVFFRSDRIAVQHGLFYFSTREGTSEGPYRSREQTDIAIAFYIRCCLDPSCMDSNHYRPDPSIHRYTECKHSLRWEKPKPLDAEDDGADDEGSC